LAVAQAMGGQTCSIEKSFVESYKHRRGAKSLCDVNANNGKQRKF